LLAALVASALSAGAMSVYSARLACHIGNTDIVAGDLLFSGT
jgi:hydroxymethylglutaryl-CoA reductase